MWVTGFGSHAKKLVAFLDKEIHTKTGDDLKPPLSKLQNMRAFDDWRGFKKPESEDDWRELERKTKSKREFLNQKSIIIRSKDTE